MMCPERHRSEAHREVGVTQEQRNPIEEKATSPRTSAHVPRRARPVWDELMRRTRETGLSSGEPDARCHDPAPETGRPVAVHGERSRPPWRRIRAQQYSVRRARQSARTRQRGHAEPGAAPVQDEKPKEATRVHRWKHR